MHNAVTVADELLIQSLPEEILNTLDKMFGDSDRMEYSYLSGKQEAFREARKNLRSWFYNNPIEGMTPDLVNELESYLDT